MKAINDLRGTNYDLVDYYGCADAEEVIVTMGSSAQTVQQTVDHLLKQGRKSRGLDNSFVSTISIGSLFGKTSINGQSNCRFRP